MQREYEPLMQELLRLLREEFGDRVRSLLVFGSVARGAARPDSDVDMCVVLRELPVSRYRVINFWARCWNDSDRAPHTRN